MRNSPAVSENAITDIPYPTSEIAPQLSKSGLRIQGPEAPTDYAFDLIAAGIITPELLREQGFILFENHSGKRSFESPIYRPGNDTQYPHQDGIMEKWGTRKWKEGSVLLHSPETMKGLTSATGIGEKHQVYQTILELYGDRTPKLPPSDRPSSAIDIAFFIRKKILGMHKDGLSHNEPIDRWFEGGKFKDVAKSPGELILELTRKGAYYPHRWRPNQLLLLDNSAMVHGRVSMQNDHYSELDRSNLIWDDASRPFVMDAGGSGNGKYVLLS